MECKHLCLYLKSDAGPTDTKRRFNLIQEFEGSVTLYSAQRNQSDEPFIYQSSFRRDDRWPSVGSSLGLEATRGDN
jgi:hypothetical protein